MNDPLAGPVYARTTDPETSHTAAASISVETARTRRYRCLQVIRDHGPISDDDWFAVYVDRWPGKYSYSHRSRRTELRDLGFVRDSGMRKKNPSGRPAILWEVTEAGRLASEGEIEAAWELLRERKVHDTTKSPEELALEEIDRLVDPFAEARPIYHVLADVRRVVNDWRKNQDG